MNDLDTIHVVHWLLTSFLALGAVIIGFLVQRLIVQYDDKVDCQVFTDYKRDMERTLDSMVSALSDKSDKSTMEQLMNDVRQRQSLMDNRWSELMKEHGRLMQVFEDLKRRTR